MSEQEKNNDNYLARWLQGDSSPEEIQGLRQSGELDKYERIITEVDTWGIKELDTKGSFNRLKSKLDDHQKEAKVVKLNNSRRTWFALAACIVLLVASYTVFVSYYSGDNLHEYATAAGEHKEVKLPDGTVIVLNGRSSLSYNPDEYDKKKEVNLKGTAYFKVVKGENFKVNLDRGVVQVLGTRYDIRSSEEYFSVQCFEGKVRVSQGENESTILEKGMGVHFVVGKSFESFEVKGDTPDWIKQNTSFVNAPLLQVIDALESQYEIEVVADEINIDRKFTGSFVNYDLKLAAKVVFEPLDIKYEIDGDRIILK